MQKRRRKAVMGMDELKLCPFCGGEAEVKTQDYFDAACGRRTYYAICRECRCRTSNFMGEVGAIDAWNRREMR